jgi:D-alanyl-lipoteichoic acid acyltransferase DltB (MBOAT superfamily)
VYFSSFGYFLLFLPIVFVICQLARRVQIARAPQICILLASAVFYAWLKPAHLGYLAGSVVANWLVARLIDRAAQPRRKHLLQLGLVLNIGFLCIFKYLNFFIGLIPRLASLHIQAPDLAFPLGISFFTLAQVMYLVDCYEELIPSSTLFDHATFVSFFPYVISGPISRAKRILHQFPGLNGSKGPCAEQLARATFLFSIGLAKKVILADVFSNVADFGFSNIDRLSGIESWSIAMSYSFQIYFDFSGYSDMAIASALFLGIEIPRNFDSPLRSRSIIEFWQRWHITLSSFITTYLYTPILRSFDRATLGTAAIATMLAMTIAGLWHGPSLTFVIFGAIHGAGLVINQYWRKKKLPRFPKLISWCLTMAVICTAFVFFRSPDIHTAISLLGHMFGGTNVFGHSNFKVMNGEGRRLMVAIYLLAEITGVLIVFFSRSSDQLQREFAPNWKNAVATATLLLLSMLYLNSNVARPFVYFAF